MTTCSVWSLCVRSFSLIWAPLLDQKQQLPLRGLSVCTLWSSFFKEKIDVLHQPSGRLHRVKTLRPRSGSCRFWSTKCTQIRLKLRTHNDQTLQVVIWLRDIQATPWCPALAKTFSEASLWNSTVWFLTSLTNKSPYSWTTPVDLDRLSTLVGTPTAWVAATFQPTLLTFRTCG